MFNQRRKTNMKNIIKTSLILAAIVASTAAYANDSNTLKPERKSPTTAINIENVRKNTKLTIKDKNNYVFYKQMIDKSGAWSKLFNFTNLPDAEYTIELDNEVEIVIIPLIIKANIATVINEEERKIIKPSVSVKNDRVYLTKMSLLNKTTNIEILYEGTELIYNETFIDTTIVNRVFDFTASAEGNYFFVIESENMRFTENIYIENKF